MKYVLSFLLMLSAPCLAQVPMTGAGKAVGGGGGGYQGPGDVVTSPTAFWSCSRAVTAAYAAGAGNACDIADAATGAITCTMKFATNGFADLTSNLCAGGTLTVPAFCTAHTSCVVTRAYEQTGATNCTSATVCHATQATNSARPALTFSCLGTIPCMTVTGSSSQELDTPAWTVTTPQPCTYMGVVQRTSGTTQQTIVIDTTFSVGTYFSGSSAGIIMYAGSITSAVAAANGSPHAFQAVFGGGGTSFLNVDSSGATTVTPGGTACMTNTDFLGISPGTGFLTGIVWEVGLWPVAFNGTQITSMNSNQHTQYGF